ncbi:hypothetical protein [Streptomyces decoyicus]|uniref:hypothetical protein n=1 Tax=Streptomyces decoyicus TaxID=249567 RepID=UPI003637ADEE
MIPGGHKRGKRTIGLLYYLYRPGTHEEHIEPHPVAAWEDFTPDPGHDPHATYGDLHQRLDQPVQALAPSRPRRSTCGTCRPAPELGMELEGGAEVEGLVADQCTGLDGDSLPGRTRHTRR